jgi:probable F420-dependent oxidoreductase
VGITLPQAGQQATRQNVIHTAQRAEKEGFDSLWVFERLLWPINPQTPYPGTPDGSLLIESQNVFDPLETLTYVAANTDRITLGTSVIDMLFHNPVVLARRFATLDVLSEGRTICGLGIGWSKDEYQVSNIPFKDRGKRADEFIETLKRIWTDDVVEFRGKFYNIPASKIGPKPVQKPGIPIYLGGFSPNTFVIICCTKSVALFCFWIVPVSLLWLWPTKDRIWRNQSWYNCQLSKETVIVTHSSMRMCSNGMTIGT